MDRKKHSISGDHIFIPGILVLGLLIWLLVSGIRDAPILSLDMRPLKELATETPASAYDQYDMYFTKFCKINDHVADSDKQVAEKGCASISKSGIYTLCREICWHFAAGGLYLGQIILEDFTKQIPKKYQNYVEMRGKIPDNFTDISY